MLENDGCDDGSGFGFGLNLVPPVPLRSFNQTIDLERIQEIAEALALDEIPNDPNAEQVQDLLLLGTSIGGAHPKAVFEDGESLWIAKFARSGDRGTTRGSRTPCSSWRANAASMRPKAESKR